MILIGQYDSPFVRRVAIALRLYDVAYEHRPWSTFGDADKIAPYNPLTRVPTLVLDDGEVLIESGAILDHLDAQAGAGRALIAASGAPRRHALRICALATGLGDKAVALVYERILHPTVSDAWIARCDAQIRRVLDALETEAVQSEHAGPFFHGAAIGHSDIATACMLRFLREAHPDFAASENWPALARQAARCEALPAFSAVVQAFSPPGR